MILTALLLILEVLSSILLIAIILMQKSKGGGLGGSAFGGGGGDSIFGARAGNVLTKLTIGLSVFFLANTLALAFIFADSGDEESVMRSTPVNAPLEPLQPIDSGVGDGFDPSIPPPVESMVGDMPDVGEPMTLDAPVETPVETPAAP